MYNRRLNEERRRKRGQISRPVFIYRPGGVFKGNAPRRIEPLPKIFGLEENRDEVVAFLDSLRSRIALNSKIRSFPLRSGRIRKIEHYFDFPVIEKITPAAALVLAAEYDRARLKKIASIMIRASHAGKKLISAISAFL